MKMQMKLTMSPTWRLNASMRKLAAVGLHDPDLHDPIADGLAVSVGDQDIEHVGEADSVLRPFPRAASPPNKMPLEDAGGDAVDDEGGVY